MYKITVTSYLTCSEYSAINQAIDCILNRKGHCECKIVNEETNEIEFKYENSVVRMSEDFARKLLPQFRNEKEQHRLRE